MHISCKSAKFERNNETHLKAVFNAFLCSPS